MAQGRFVAPRVDWEDYEGWTARTVRRGIKAVAGVTGEDPQELLEAATEAAKRAIIGKEQAAE